MNTNIANTSKAKVLVVGCGLRPKRDTEVDEYTNLDKIGLPGVDVIWDLDNVPLPFNSDHFDHIIAEDVIEHLDHPVDVVNDLGRILKVGGTLWIRGPSAKYPEELWHDLTHKRAFTERTFAGWDPSTWDGQRYGHYHSGVSGIYFTILKCEEKNKGLEVLMERIGRPTHG